MIQFSYHITTILLEYCAFFSDSECSEHNQYHFTSLFIGDVVRQVRAVDADGDEITYEIVSHSGDSSDIFFITPSNGEIRTLKSLTTAAQQSYTVSTVDVCSKC